MLVNKSFVPHVHDGLLTDTLISCSNHGELVCHPVEARWHARDGEIPAIEELCEKMEECKRNEEVKSTKKSKEDEISLIIDLHQGGRGKKYLVLREG